MHGENIIILLSNKNMRYDTKADNCTYTSLSGRRKKRFKQKFSIT